MIINASKKDLKKLKALLIEYPNDGITFKEDNTLSQPIIMVTDNGEIKEWTRGMDNVSAFMKYGYVRLKKDCPIRTFRKCICEKCQWYMILNGTGDCATVWAIFKASDAE